MIYLLDGNQEVIKIVRSSAVISAIQTQELPEDNSLLRDYLSVRLKNDERLFNAQYMAIKSYGGNRNAFDLYRIASELVPDNATEFMGVQVAPYELEGVVIEDLRPQNRPLNQTMNQVLEGSDWRLGYVSDNLPNVTTNFYYMSVKDALKKLQEMYGIEMLFKVEISGNKITDKWVEVYHQLGNRTMKRFNYGTNALSVVRESSHDELYTALIGRGKGEEVGETESGDATYGRKIDFADVEWSVANGAPVDKPKGQKYIELPNATAEYGIKLLDGRKVPRIGIVEFNDTDDPNVLINQTWQELLVRARPKVLFKASVINTGDMLIGDTVTIHRHDLDFHYQARVRKVVRDRKNNNKTQVEIGDVVHTASTKRQGQINSALNNVTSDLENVRGEVTEARQSADGKNTNFYGNVEPERKKVGDTWFRDHPSLTGESQILVWNGEAWELIMDTSETTKNANAIAGQQQEIDEAKEVADEALSEIEVAIRNAGFTSLDDTIKSVQSRANTAFDTANDLIGEVSGYSQTVDGFNQTVNNYTNQVANFRSDVNGFSSTVTQYSSAVSDYATQVSTLTNEVSGFNSTVANIDGRVTTLNTTVNGISSTVSDLGGRVSAVEQTAAGLQTTVASKASQSQVTQLSNAYNVFVGGIEDRKNLLPGMESGGLYSDTGNEYDTTSYIRSPYIPIKDSGAYIVSLDGNPISCNIYLYTDIGEFHSSTGYSDQYKFVAPEIKYIRIFIGLSNPNLKYQLEKGYSSTDYVPFIGDVSSAQISMLQDNINLRVEKGDLLSQINIEADRMLFQSDKILLDADNVIFSGTAWMDGTVIANASIDGAKITDATIGSAKIANLDVDKLSGNITNFIQSTWDTATGGNVKITGSGILTTASTGSQVQIANGMLYIRNSAGSNLGQLGYVRIAGASATHYVRVHTAHGTNFAISQVYGTERLEKDVLEIHTRDTGSSIMNLNTNVVTNGNTVYFSNEERTHLGSIGKIGNTLRIIGPQGGDNNSIALYGQTSGSAINIAYSVRTYSTGTTINRMWAQLDMGGSNITNQSDERLKRDIIDNEINSLEAIKKWRIAGFNWIDSSYDQSRRFGVIAQSAPEIAFENHEGYLNVDGSKQLQMTTHAVQQLALGHDANERKIHKLQQELSKANRRIEELEGAV